MDIIDAIRDDKLFRPFLGDDLTSWRGWLTALRCLYGLGNLAPREMQLIEQCCGRSVAELPKEGFQTAVFLVGRRGGKSRVAAIVGAFESLFGGHERRLAKGEQGVLAIVAPVKYQGSLVWKYLLALFEVPLLAAQVERIQERSQAITLRNGVEVRVLTGDYKTIRGPSLICAILDEVCFFGMTEESKIRSDLELVRAVRPALATTGGRLIAISSKYGRKGWAFNTWLRFHGANKDGGPTYSPKWTTLVWDAPSRVMNPLLDEKFVEAAYADDPAAARSEFGNEWREDLIEFIPRSWVERLIEPGRKELLPRDDAQYRAGLDLSGGRSDSASLCVLHREGNTIIQDLSREWRAPFDPYAVVREIAKELRRFGLSSVAGDAYAGSWPTQAFRPHGINYRLAKRSKSELYLELLPLLCGGRKSIELLDNPIQTSQLASLERKTRSGGKDSVDHPRGARDDVANSLAVAADTIAHGKRVIGSLDSFTKVFENL